MMVFAVAFITTYRTLRKCAGFRVGRAARFAWGIARNGEVLTPPVFP